MERPRASSSGELAARVAQLRARPGRAVVVAVSGFGGAGKTTLAEALQDLLPDAVVVPGDEFLRERPTVTRSDDWAAMDRGRLLEEVLLPLRRGEPARYRTFDWASGALGARVTVEPSATVIIEGLGLFHPDLNEHLDLRIWLDVDLDTATARGMWRDEHVWANAQTDLWLQVWKPNDADFFVRFRPDLAADVLYQPR